MIIHNNNKIIELNPDILIIIWNINGLNTWKKSEIYKFELSYENPKYQNLYGKIKTEFNGKYLALHAYIKRGKYLKLMT